MGSKGWYLSGLIIAALTAAALVAPAAAPAGAAALLSLHSYPAVETARGPARTAALPGGGLLVVNAFGAVTSQAADGRVNWTRTSSSLYQDWGVQWQTPSYVLSPQLPWGSNPVNPLQFSGANTGLVNDVTPFATGDLTGDGNTDVAVAEVVGVDTTDQTDCAGCMTPFDVPGSTLHLGTFVTVLDGRTGRTLYDELDPGYVTQLAIVGGRLVVGDESGDPQRPDGIGAWGSVTTVQALSFIPGGHGLVARQDWQYSTGSPWARLLGVAVTGPDTVAISWSDTPEGLGVPGPPDGHVLLFDARTGAARWQVRTAGYPVLLAADPSRKELVTVELTDPTVSTGYAVDSLKLTNGSIAVSGPQQAGALPLSLAVSQPAGNAGSEWAVGAVNAKVPPGAGGYNATSGRVSLIDPATGQEAWSTELPKNADGVPQPGGVVFAGGAVVAGSWLSTVYYPTAGKPYSQLDSVTALSAADGTTRWQQTGDPGDPMSLSVSPDGQSVHAVTSRQVIETYSADGSVSRAAAAPGDLLSGVTASVTGPGSTDLVAGDENGEVYAYDGADLADGRPGGPRVLWHTMLPGPVQDVVTADLNGSQVVVAAATTAVAVLDARTGRIITLISLHGAYVWTVSAASDGATPVAVVPGRSLTAYALATGKVKWRYQPPGTAMFSNAAAADGIVAAEYSGAEISGNPAATMGTVGIDAATGKPAWAVPADPATTQRGQLWQGVIASPAIPGAGGYGVATSWETPDGQGRVEVRDIRTGTLLYADTDDVLDFHTGFAADSQLGLVAISQQGAALITPAGPQDNTITANGLSATVASSAGTGPVLLIANAETYAYGPDLFTAASANDLAIDNTFNAGTVLSADFAGNGTDQVVALPPNWDAFQIVNSEIGRAVNPNFETLQHGLDVLTLTAGTSSASGNAAPPPANGPASGTWRPAPAWQEPARQGGAQPFFIVGRHAKGNAANGAADAAAPPGYSPAQMRSYLGLSGDGSGQTIAIADAYRDPTIVADAEQFSTQFGLPGVCGAGGTAGDCFKLKVTRPDGTAGTDQNWDLETALDVEWTHALAPRATIMLVEAHDQTFGALFRAVDDAVAAHPAAVSMSWGINYEFSDEAYYDGHCAVTATVCVVASGDYGHPGSYPAYNPHVIAVGGTTLNLAADGSVMSELAWSDSGGGTSWVEPEPAYQQQVTSGSGRQMPDVSFDADPATGVAVYDGSNYQGQTGWFQVGGTSVGAPSWSAILADADQLRAAAGRAPLTAAGYAAQLAIYDLPAGALAEISSGPPNGFCPVGCTPGPGFEDVTGLGSPRQGIDAALAAAP
jgi:outer membrane protein assembly factor BamB